MTNVRIAHRYGGVPVVIARRIRCAKLQQRPSGTFDESLSRSTCCRREAVAPLAVEVIERRKPVSFPAEVWIVSVTTFLSRSVGFLALYSTVFYTSIGLSAAALSLALFAAGLAGVLGSLAGGWFAARFGSTDVLIAGSVLNVPLLFLLGSLSTEPVSAIVSASLSVAVTQSFAGPAAALVTGSGYQGDTVTVVAFHRIFLSSGVTVAPIVVAVVGEQNFSTLFFLSSLGSLLTGVLLLSERARLRSAEERARTRESATEFDPRSATETGYDTFRTARLWAVVGVFATAMAIYAQSTSGTPLSLERISGGGQLYGVLIAVNSIFIIVCELPLSFVTSRIRWNYALGLGIFVTGLGLAVCGLGTSWTVCISGFVLFSLGEAIFLPQASAAIAKLSTSSENARYQGFLSAAQSIGFAVGPGIGAFGVLHDLSLYWALVVQISFVTGAVAVVAGVDKNRSPDRVR
ncbi:MFS transporter [Nocardia sp. CDC186]|uniref:MFS transporter n=1 Tax=Nocardia implantans TaxID=3108168 RepID=A0ABU6B431_9NOCA|nr:MULTISPECIES: MFS transporter [unclassified Nocardia]MEA3527764.1 MFS transporter [Nocardia sp. CDC192]MEB3514530.1 MFS transporter [Nocardia sp. CDC186]